LLAAAGLALAIALPFLHAVIPHEGLHSRLAHAEAPAPVPGPVPPVPRARGDNCPSDPPPFIEDSFPQPEFRHSRNGVLQTTLRAAAVPTLINGESHVSSVYEGSFPGPTLVFCPGDLVAVTLENGLDPANFEGHHHAGYTNLHTHGLHVSPRSPQDDVFVEVAPGASRQYRYEVPRNHRPGAYWYHPHLHGQASPQTRAGMAGAIVVEGGLDRVPAYRRFGQRLLVIQKAPLGTVDDPTAPEDAPPRFLVNGHLRPEIPIRPGEIQRWSVLNATTGFGVRLALQGRPLHLLARDGNYLERRRARNSMSIAPGSRREVLVVGGPEGRAELVARPHPQFPGDDPPRETLATVAAGGSSARDRLPPRRITRLRDLREEKVDGRHDIVFTEEGEGTDDVQFFVNGRQFEPNRIDEVMHLGDVEQWRISNASDEWHTFHIHIQDFQVTKIDGRPVNGIYDADNVWLPPDGTITMRTKPARYTGKFVFHCHILGHEDRGAMATVAVRK
jgi:suppressor of ftsI